MMLFLLSIGATIRAIARFWYSHIGPEKMAAKPLTIPRKNASQARSRATVNALIEATARILVREGFDKASTNRVAEVAGVSVGSLYQYFPSKEALVAAVIERHSEEVANTVRQEVAAIETQSLEQGLRTIVAGAVKAHRVNPKLHRVLAEQIPRVGKLEKAEAFSRENFALFRNYLERHRHEIRALDLDLATFICVTSIEALTHNAVLHHSRVFANAAIETLIDEGARLLVGFLTR
jgi:AcrR family transcriptional regulator